MSQLILVRNKGQAACPVLPGKGWRSLGAAGAHREGRKEFLGRFPGQLSGREAMGMASLWEQGSAGAELFLALGGESHL